MSEKKTETQPTLFPPEEFEEEEPNPTVNPEAFDIFREFTLEDLPSDEMRWVAASIGLPSTIKLIQDLQGIRIDFPKMALKRVIHRYIQKKYDGTNAKLLARQFNLCERWIYKICNKKEKA